MKKFFTITLAIVMMMAMATTAFAAEGSGKVEGENGGTQNIDVSAKYQNGVTEAPVVSVNVAWDAMEFTYTVGGTKTWDPDEHKYTTTDSTGAWSQTNNTVTVTNHSNIDVKVKAEYASVEAYKGITGTFTYTKTTDDDGFVALTRGAENKKAEADKVVATLKLNGELANDVTTATKIGTITVTISKK